MHREPDHVYVLLKRSFHNHLGRLVESRVNHLHARIPKRSRYDLRTAIMPI
jgi:hypothetical protein